MSKLPGGVHNTEAPHDLDSSTADFPILVFQALDTADSYVLTGRATEEVPYVFRAGVEAQDNTVVHAILDRVDFLLQDYALVVTGYVTLYLRRIGRGPVIPVTEYGRSYRQGTSRYRTEVQPT